MEEKTYYEKVLESFNRLTLVESRQQFYNTIDFSKKIEKDSDANIISEIKKFKDFADARIFKDKKPKEKEEVDLPGEGKLISIFAKEVSNEIKDKNTLFFRSSSRQIVEIGKIKCNKTEEDIYTGFMEVKPNRFITFVEKYFIPGYTSWNDTKKRYEFSSKSMSCQLSTTLLASEILQQNLPQIDRIFTIPIPIKYEGKLTFPKKGYDERFNSWLPYNAPEITDTEMSLEEAKKLLAEIYKEFCFQNRQDYVNSIASLLTPFLRGLFPSFNTRTPVFFFLANRERAGKDYLAGIGGIIYEGHSTEESPISNSENARSNNTEELRKKILAAMINGRKRLHFANNKGYINNAVFEAVTTAERYSDRLLGKNDILTFDNEIDFSLSGNVGVGFTPDFANRSRFIRLHLDIEDANSRAFDNPNLHKWLKDNRGLVLSALYSLVNNWIKNGEKEGSINFTSFPQWASICGGIMESAGYDNPCISDKETLAFGGDNETKDIKELFELCYNKFSNQWIKKNDIKNILISDDCNLFSYIDFDKKSGQTKFGNQISKFVGRVFSDIRLIVRDPTVRSSRQELKFTKDKIETNKSLIFDEIYQKNDDFKTEVTTLTEGTGNLGNLTVPSNVERGHHNIEHSEKVAKVTKVTKTELPFTDEEIKQSGYTREELNNMMDKK